MLYGGPEPVCFVVKEGVTKVENIGVAAMSAAKTEQGSGEENKEGYR